MTSPTVGQGQDMPQDTGASANADQALVSDEAPSGLHPSGFDPSRYGLSAGAAIALIKHTREDGPLNEEVLGKDESEELWFCSMLRATSGGKRLCTRGAWTSGISGGTHYNYELTTVGRAMRNAIATEAGTAATVKQGAVHEGAGPKGSAHD